MKLLTDGYKRIRKQGEILPPVPKHLVWMIKNITPDPRSS